MTSDGGSAPGRPVAADRIAVSDALRDHLKDLAGLRPLADAAVVFFNRQFDADASSITLMRGGWFRTLVTVDDVRPDEVRHPDGQTYPVETYPTVARVLAGGGGYVSSIGNDGGIPESQRFLEDFQKVTCIGVPIVYAGESVGEVFVSRGPGRAHYTGRELATALDLARQLGLRIGPGMRAQDEVNVGWWPVDQRDGPSAEAAPSA